MGQDRAAALDAARTLLRQAEQRVGVTSHDPQPITATTPRTGGLELLLPTGLPTGAACTITGSTTLLLMALAAAQSAERWVAFVGMPALGMIAVHEAGIDLRRVAHIPDVAGNGTAVVAALLDGVGHVVVGPACPLAPADRRRLLARARERDTTLVATYPWEGTALTLEAQRTAWTGAERGDYWLREARWDVLRRSKADGPGARFTIHRGAAGELTVEQPAPGLRLVTGVA
ncbi:hypothetical protein Xcel_3475 (plasmid) [Xylanimonas cellulosilytica DSM 15894]|uniref:Protein ImuA n=1 Tax=Xylanimonas cellulosilytica (strain DSM 15894 / JCM 12276 / CECT 5975 / KCTC 9989 / LMG 20990 / NBRC 107835 / XIL07) TaxID=446471 RepID=D1C108_XYLCX|nr:hypothetical protein [Xylanimonas cellulosilytica]ACZ32474.1 hypothetical protein Xcel_3475 [Xylanimonas cellulosilytica DSM 15894]